MLAANSRVTDNGFMSQANSFLANCARNFVPFDDAMPSNTARDAIQGATMFDSTAQASGVYDVGSNDNNRAWGQDGPQVGVVLQLAPEDPIDKDFMLVICGEAIADPGATFGADQGGYIHFELSGINAGIDVFPYYARFDAIGVVPAVTAFTKRWCEGMHRIPGQNYLYAAVKRGEWLEHWAVHPDFELALLVDRVNVVQWLENKGAPLTHWNNITLTSGLNTGETCHAASDPRGQCRFLGAGSWHQYFYGWQWFIFDNGMPDNLAAGLKWTYDEWINNPSGDKRIFPEWVVV